MICVTELFFYPIKSCRGIQVTQTEVTPKGFAWDREFMWVDEHGLFITQRKHPNLARIEVQIAANSVSLSLAESDLPPFTFEPTFNGKEIEVDVWRTHTVAIDQGDEVAQWLQAALAIDASQQFRLVRQSPQYPRYANPQYAPSDREPVSFADGYPFLITTSASLAELNKRITAFHQDNSQTIPMNRFRPNIVVHTDEPFSEDQWQSIQIGEVKFTVAKPCDRCIVTTTDQTTGKRNNLKEPLRTLATFRQFGKAGILFGQNLIPRNTGMINEGAEVKILAVS